MKLDKGVFFLNSLGELRAWVIELLGAVEALKRKTLENRHLQGEKIMQREGGGAAGESCPVFLKWLRLLSLP